MFACSCSCSVGVWFQINVLGPLDSINIEMNANCENILLRPGPKQMHRCRCPDTVILDCI